MVDGREVLQIMGGTINWTTEDVPLAILDRVEIIRGPGLLFGVLMQLVGLSMLSLNILHKLRR